MDARCGNAGGAVMKIEDDDLLKRFALPGKCENCGKFCKRREGAHLVAKGMGGGRRVDVPFNLLSFGSSLLMLCPCHTASHQEGNPSYAKMLDMIAKREGEDSDDIERAIWFILRTPKDLSACRIEESMKELPVGARSLVRRELVKAGKL